MAMLYKNIYVAVVVTVTEVGYCGSGRDCDRGGVLCECHVMS